MFIHLPPSLVYTPSCLLHFLTSSQQRAVGHLKNLHSCVQSFTELSAWRIGSKLIFDVHRQRDIPTLYKGKRIRERASYIYITCTLIGTTQSDQPSNSVVVYEHTIELGPVCGDILVSSHATLLTSLCPCMHV